MVVLPRLLYGVTRWKVVLITQWGQKPRALTPVHLSSKSVPPLWQVALTRETDFPKVYRGSFLVHMVADHTGEVGIGNQGPFSLEKRGEKAWMRTGPLIKEVRWGGRVSHVDGPHL